MAERRRVLTDEEEAELTRLYTAGIGSKALSQQFNVHIAHVAKVVRRNGGQVRRRGTYLTHDDEAEIVRQWRQGDRRPAIAARFGVSVSCVTEVARRHGASRPVGAPQRRFLDEQIVQMIDLWRRGDSQARIALKFGTTQTAVSRAMRSHGVSTYGGKRTIPAGDQHGAWKGGKVNLSGYVGVLVQPDDPLASMRQSMGYVLEHRLVMARALGRPLTRHETVHHINGDITDNRLENLQLRQGRHGKGVVMQCRCCGSTDIEAAQIAG